MTCKPLLVTAGIIRKEDLILITQRKKDSLLEPNKWEFPGGKVEYLEHPEDCLVREIKEELDINISIEEFLTLSSHIYIKDKERYHIILLAFLAKWLKGEVKNIDCQDSKWVSYEKLNNYNFAEADKHIIKSFLQRSKK